jgi:23S rRNA pseudouridine1911/1915/1917 synthase
MERITYRVEEDHHGTRLDRFVSDRTPDQSRAVVQRAIREGAATINGAPCLQPSRKLRAGECVEFALPEVAVLVPRPAPAPVLYEDEAIVVVDKPSGLVVHPGAGSHEATLVEALLCDRELAPSDDPARPGVVHRLDKDTSGVIVLAKTAASLSAMQQQFADRSVTKLYVAVVEGVLAEEEGLIDAPVGRDPRSPRRMDVSDNGRPAQTLFDVLQRDETMTLLAVRPITGRTHQVRVHFRYIDHPVVGDELYGRAAERLLLHAWRLRFTHPVDGRDCRFEATVPAAFPSFDYPSIAWPEGP